VSGDKNIIKYDKIENVRDVDNDLCKYEGMIKIENN